MARNRYSPEQIIAKLSEVVLSQVFEQPRSTQPYGKRHAKGKEIPNARIEALVRLHVRHG